MRNLLSKLLPIFVSASIAASTAFAADTPANAQPKAEASKPAAQPQKAEASKPAAQPDMTLFAFPTVPKKDIEPNTLTEGVSKEAKMKAVQSMMAFNPLSMREMISLMTYKIKAKPGVSFDEVVDSMKLRANFHNFKFVGHNPLSKDVQAITGKPTPRVEMFSFCDSILARSLLDYMPELVAFLPCRIAVLEDAHKDIWLITLDWDISWMDYSQNPNKMSPELYKEAKRIRDAMDDMMTAGANGDL